MSQPTLHRSRRALVLLALLLLLVASLAVACAPTSAPPTPTPTPTPSPTPTPTPEPTPTPAASSEAAAQALPAVTPKVTIPQGFKPEMDENLGYSLALPSGWTNLDLRSKQFQSMAGTFGMADQLAPLNEFLESPEGEAVGMVAITDLTSVMFGGLPTLLNVSVIDAPGITPEQMTDMIQRALEANSGMLGDITVESLESTTVNKLPAVAATVTGDLSSVGMNSQIFAKVVGLLANDKVYMLTLASEEGNRTQREPVFDQIIGTFRPE